YHFLTRDTITDGVYGANERVMSRVDLLRMITINYAKLTGEADIKGSIETGKLADFVVLSDDILAVAERSIPQMKALATYVGGKEVYRDAGWTPCPPPADDFCVSPQAQPRCRRSRATRKRRTIRRGRSP